MPFPTFTKVWHNESYDAIRPSRTSLSAAGKTVFITGGNQGIGAATARAFAEAKASTIAITGRREHKLLETKNAIEAVRSSTRVVTFAIDVLDEEAMNTAFRLLGTVDVLVNNAGYLPDTKSIVESDVDDWWRGMEVNVKGAFIVTRAFIQVASEDAVIVNLTTAGSHLPPLRNFSGYNPGKLAANKFFEHVQAEHPQLRVYSLHPGVIESEMSKKSGPAFAKHEIVFKKDHGANSQNKRLELLKNADSVNRIIARRDNRVVD